MSRSKKLGSIYANNRKRRVVSDDEHSEDEFFESTNHNASSEAMKRNDHHDNAGIGHKKLDPVERCQAKLRSLRQHLAILRHEAAEVEKEIARWEWEAAAAVKAAKLRSREAERASARNGHMHGYAMSGTGAQKRRRVLHHLDEGDDNADAPWGPAGASRGSRIVQEWFPAAVKNAANGTKRPAAAWEHAMDEEDDDHDDDDHHGAVEIDDMDMAMEHDTDEDSGASAWGKLIDSVPSPRQGFEVVIERPPSTLALRTDKQPVVPAVSGSETPLFFGSSSDDFTESESSPKPTLPANPIELLSPPHPNKTTNLCFSPLALSAPPTTNSTKDTNPNKTFSPLSLLPSTPMRMATRPRPPSDSSFESSSGAAESVTPPPHQLITPKRPATTAVSSSSNPNPQSAGKSFVPSPGFFGTYDERRKMARLEPLPRVEFDEF